MTEQKTESIAVRVRPETKDEIEEISFVLDVTTSTLGSALIEYALSEMRVSDLRRHFEIRSPGRPENEG